MLDPAQNLFEAFLDAHYIFRRRNNALELAQNMFEAFLDTTDAYSKCEPQQAARM